VAGLTEMEKAELRLKSVEIALQYGKKHEFATEDCFEKANKIFRFVRGIEFPPGEGEGT